MLQLRGGNISSYALMRSRIQKGEIDPFYIFFGEEIFLKQDLITRIKKNFFKGEELDLFFQHFYAGDIDIHDLINNCNSQALSMFVQKKMIIVDDVDLFSEKELKVLLAYLEQPSETTCLVLNSLENKVTKLNKKEWEDRTAIFYPLYENKLKEWIISFAKENKKNISADTADLLIGLCNNSLLEINNELNKLFIYTGERPEISGEDVQHLIGDTRQFDIFQLIDAVTARNYSLSLKILMRLYESGDDGYPSARRKAAGKGKDSKLYGFFSLLNSTIHDIYQIKHLMERERKSLAEIEKLLHIHQFRLKKMAGHNKQYNFDKFNEMIRILFDFDFKFKTSSALKKDRLFKNLIYELCYS